MKRVVIVGAGFAGLRAAKVLAGQDLEVVVVDRQNYHLFQPLLYQVASAGLEPENIAYPIRSVLRRFHNVRFVMGEVQSIDLPAREVLTDRGSMGYDYLILAAGSVPTFFGLESLQEHAFALKGLNDAIVLRNHLLYAFERAATVRDPVLREALTTFVIVGAGPTGVEMAGSLAEVVYRALPRDYPDLRIRDSRLILVEATGEVLPSFPPRLRKYARRRLERLGVEVMLDTRVADAAPGRVLVEGGDDIPTHTLLWTAGVRGAPVVDALAVPKTRANRVVVAPDLSVQGNPDVFVVGDMAHVEQDGEPLPMVAPVAIQQGEHAARSILRRERGQEATPFRYRSRGTMAIIGRYAAVADSYGLQIKGVVAWVIWLALHLYYLIGFRNRLMALLNWAYAYLLIDPKLRLITSKPRRLSERLGSEKGDERSPPPSGCIP